MFDMGNESPTGSTTRASDHVVSAADGYGAPSEWIVEGLASPLDYVVASWVPAGFEAYARALHEVQGFDDSSRVVCWREVAFGSGVRLDPATNWIDVALHEVAPSQRPRGATGAA